MPAGTAERLRDVIASLRSGGRRHRMVLCPAHEDGTPSLSVSIARDGKVLLKCHAGCTYQAIVAAAALTPAELFPDRQRLDSESTPRGRATAVYPYEDE